MKENDEAIDSLPEALQKLVRDELASGNEIVEVGHSFPAPPVGCYVKLARRVSSRPRESTEEIAFYERNSSLWSGEFSDPKRFHFVLEPPLPPPEMPDMDAIREVANAEVSAPQRASVIDRFRDSMPMNYERWREGIGYDLEALREASAEERDAIEHLLVSRSISDWRDVEALAALGTPGAHEALRHAMKTADFETQLAVVRYAADIVGDDECTRCVLEAIESADDLGSLTRLLLIVEDLHPPEVIEALLRGVREASGETAVHFAAMLTWLHGKAESPFDWSQRPFFLQFLTNDPEERRNTYEELCNRLGIA